eukprot:CAMPEP_0117418854 /NCGR_PEP_ID=MMETSP0758-20121206/552_1 /TAXON_ID=63605 /ORGANISM="Percolomonas cosmopolitus, Strain AE-1 (ATCC 50343)" /LENGTH=302 /DNA_ID=CAMNT_0005199607 /DNA_START=165 /DNA_END=1073 /DNA_ORIENTATION=+
MNSSFNSSFNTSQQFNQQPNFNLGDSVSSPQNQQQGTLSNYGSPNNKSFQSTGGMNTELAAMASPSRLPVPMVSNSKAVIAALKALQAKIKKLEDERNYYKSNYESSKTSFESSQRAFSDEKMNLMKQKESILMDRNTMSSTLTRVQEKLSTAEHERSYYASLAENNEKEKKELTIRLESLEELVEQQKQRIEHLESNIIEERETNKTADEKLDGLQRQFVRERRKRERVETDKQKIDKALKELLSIHSDLVATATNSASLLKKKKKKSTSRSTSSKKTRKSRPSSARPKSRSKPHKSRRKL